MIAHDTQDNQKHQAILGFIHVLLNLYLGFKSRGKIYMSGYPIYAGETMPGWQPDLLVILYEHYDRVRNQHLEGAADIAIEIISRSTEIEDRGQKFMEYERIGIPEYWMIDPIRQELDIYGLNKQGRYQRIKGSDEQIVSRILPDFRLNASILWKEELPVGAQVIELVWVMLNPCIKIVYRPQLGDRATSEISVNNNHGKLEL
jgi:Uma2 family endonuclease